ncbi:MAG: thioredoxin fold domain-containing protein [Gammaproteobacteria bacterium]|nr:thioredoxin fold domain-containing protein [Gammaproteobacteria bacterium]MBU2478950.1 thioredoxin fold domain-containing protein [Gammaproteobacteria bacterium]
MLRYLVTLAWLLMAVPLLSNGELPPADALEPGMVNPGYHDKPDWFKNSFLDLREDVAEAKAAGKRVMLYYYQDGCPYCKKLLETNFSLRDIETKTQSGFDVIAINIWGDREVTDLQGQTVTEKEFASQMRVMFTPTLVFLNETGDVVLRLNGYYPPHRFMAALDYVSDHVETRMSFRDYVKQQAPVAASGKLHQDPSYLQAPYQLAKRTGGRPLAVFFEQAECAACDELHQDILKRTESQALLSQYDVVVLDAWSKTPVTTPAGKSITAGEWAREMNVQYVPTLILFDAKGNEAFRTEAYLKAFHIQSALDYVATGAYTAQPNFQRYISSRAEALEAKGIHVDIMQ